MTLLRGSMQMLSWKGVTDVIVQAERIDWCVKSAGAVIAWPLRRRAEVTYALNLGVAIRRFCYITPLAILAEFFAPIWR